MSRWVTFYEDVFNGISHVVIHKDKEEATKYFKKYYTSFFELNTRPKIELPMTYGFPHRRFVGMSITSFNKKYKKEVV